MQNQFEAPELTLIGEANEVVMGSGTGGNDLPNMLRKELVDTIRSVHGGKKRIPPEIAMEMAEHHTQDALSERHL